MSHYGPQLPPHLRRPENPGSESEDDDDEVVGPKLPGKASFLFLPTLTFVLDELRIQL